jgi:hypothetical protein
MNAMTQPRLSPIRVIRLNPRHPRSTNQQKKTIMKKLYFYALLLPLWGLGGLFGTFAFAQVSVELMGKTYTDPPQVSFTVSWGAKAPYDNKIWVLAQYTKTDASGIGQEDRALITKVSATGATASTVTGHRGFWLETSGSNGSATVTATLGLAPGVEKFNECVYAFDYPPNAVPQCDNTSYQLRGSPPFTINGDIIEHSNTFGPGTYITSITDATDNPEGIVLNAGVIESLTVPAILGYPPRTYTPKSIEAANGDNAIYEWRRSGTGGSVTLVDSDALAYDINKDTDAINTPGTYYYRRYAGCHPAEGTYTLVVVASPPSPSNGKTWLHSPSNTIWTDNLRVACTAGNVIDRGSSYGLYYQPACRSVVGASCTLPWRSPNYADVMSRVSMAWINAAGWPFDGLYEADSSYNFDGYGVMWVTATNGTFTAARYFLNYRTNYAPEQGDAARDCYLHMRCIAYYNY